MKNSSVNSVKAAHDALLALMPEGASHDGCHLCTAGTFADQEVANVATDTQPVAGNVYSEAQHLSLVESAVEKATAGLTAEKSDLAVRTETLESEKAALATELSEAKSRVDVLESELATAQAAAETAKKSFEDFKAELENKASTDKKKKDRTERVKAANENLGDTYFTDERVQRWAEMSDESFDSLISELSEFAAASQPAATVSTNETARESAAFTGGESPKPNDTDEGKSALRQLFAVQYGNAALNS